MRKYSIKIKGNLEKQTLLVFVLSVVGSSKHLSIHQRLAPHEPSANARDEDESMLLSPSQLGANLALQTTLFLQPPQREMNHLG